MILGETEFRDGWSSSGNGSLLVDSVDLWSLRMPDVLQTHTSTSICSKGQMSSLKTKLL